MASAFFADSINIQNATNIIVNNNINILSGTFTLNSLTATTATAVYLPSPEYIYIGNTTTTLASTVGAGGSLPDGIIIMWSGTKITIPEGWSICDGATVVTQTKGTLIKPNLRGRFVLCTSMNFNPNTVNSSGGLKTFTLTDTHIPSHTHYVNKSNTTGKHNHTYNVRGGSGDDLSDDNAPYSTVQTSKSGNYDNHTHSYTTPYAGGVATPTPITLIPRCYALIYIIKLPP